ncbi:MAG TPA: sterol desaturase family protein, partial [Arachidicoccus soli]|nr:sterol desaturase family protein [Arachidicoccus soli]
FEPVEKFIFFIPLAVIGYRPLDILLIYALSQTYGTLAHTRVIKKLGFLEYFMITPSHHRVHHAKNVKYLDKNFGMTIVLWDKLFGTFQKEVATIPIEYGIRKEKPYNNFIDVVTHEIRQIIIDCRQPISFKQKLKYIFGKPGYSHNGSRQTAQQLREKEVRDSS